MRKATNRTELLNQLQELVGKADRGRILVVHGADGVGQRDLVSSLRESIHGKSLVLEADCAQENPLLEITRALAAAGPDACDQDALTAFLKDSSNTEESDVQTLMAMVRSRDVQNDRCEAFRRLLCDAASRQRVVVAIHNLHLADPDTQAAVHYLVEDLAGSHAVRRIGAKEAIRPVLLLTLCDDGPKGRLLVSNLKSNLGIEMVGLQRLDAKGLGQCLQDPVIADKLLRITDGLPQKVRMLVDVLPDDIEFLVRARLAELETRELETLQLASLFGRPIAPGALAVLNKVPRSTIDQLLSHGFLALDNSGAVAHLSVSESYESHPMLSVDDKKARQAMHKASAEHLQTQQSINLDESLHEPIARHLLGAGQVDQAAPHALGAGRWLAQNAALHRSAAILGDMLDAEPSQTQELVVALIDTSVALGSFDQAIELCRKLSSDQDQGLQLRLARIHSLGGDLEAAQKALEQLFDEASITAEQRQLVGLELADVLLRRGDLDRTASLCMDGLKTSNNSYTAAFNHLLGKVAFWRGQWDQAEARYQEVLDALSQPNHLVNRSDVLHNMGLVSLRQGHYNKACEQIQTGLSLMESHGAFFRSSVCRHNLAIAHEYRQNYSIAIQLFERCVENFERLGKRANLAGALNSLGDLYLTLGDTWRARKLLDYSIQVSQDNGLDYMVAYNQLKLGRLELVENQLDAAGQLAHQVMQRFDELGHSDEYAESCWLFAQVLAAQNKHQKARAALDKMSSEAGQEIQARGQIVLAQLLLSNDDAMAASRAAEQAAQSLRELGQRDGVAQALYQQSEAARIAGQSIEHGQLRTQSHEALDELRARIPQDLRDGFEQMSWVQQVGQHTEEAAVVESAVANNVVDLIEPAPKRRPPRKTQAVKECFHGMVGSSPQMRHVFSMIGRLGNAQAPILITGESGTGKELVAAAIRAESPRRNKPFVRVNAAAFAETLLESELFGHEKGAFTGAVVRKLGAFEQANGGTLFLDEIGDISPKTQVALLRVMQEREIRRVGGRHPIKVDVRILCATNRKLEIMVEEGSFRLDLYYRIKGLTVDLPPLRDRDGDLEIMCEHILAELAQTHGRRLTLSDDAAKLLSSYRWPGNVRELENVLRSVYFFAQGECVTADELRTYTLLREARAQDMIQVNHSVDEDTPIGPDFSLADAKKALEIRCIAKALEQTDGNITKAATLLGMKRPRLSQKIKEFGLKAQ